MTSSKTQISTSNICAQVYGGTNNLCLLYFNIPSETVNVLFHGKPCLDIFFNIASGGFQGISELSLI